MKGTIVAIERSVKKGVTEALSRGELIAGYGLE